MLPIIGIALCLSLMKDLPLATWIRFVAWLVIGMVIYFLYSRKHCRLRNEVPAEGP